MADDSAAAVPAEDESEALTDAGADAVGTDAEPAAEPTGLQVVVLNLPWSVTWQQLKARSAAALPYENLPHSLPDDAAAASAGG